MAAPARRGRGSIPQWCLVLTGLVIFVVLTSLIGTLSSTTVGVGPGPHVRKQELRGPSAASKVAARDRGEHATRLEPIKIVSAERMRNEIVKHFEKTAQLRPAGTQPSELSAPKYSHVTGEIARGYDLLVMHEATLSAGIERCTEDPRCQGLSFAAAVPDTKRALEIVLKTSRIASPHPGYWSWVKPISMGLPEGRRKVPRVAMIPPGGGFASGGSSALGSIGGELRPREALDITIVTQTSMDRIWMLKKLCDLWDGPVSAAVFVVGNQMADATAEMERSMCARKGHVAYMQGKHSDNYPVNALRNKARQWVRTSHWLLTDIDLWPNEGAYGTLLRLLREPWAAQAKTAIVVPAFATRHHDVKRLPLQLEALAKCIGRRECYCFKGYPGAIPAHHLTTNYPYWWHQTTRPAGESSAYKVPCFDTIVWEPYTLLPNTKATPLFDERFNGARARARAPPPRATSPGQARVYARAQRPLSLGTDNLVLGQPIACATRTLCAPPSACDAGYGKNKIQFIQHLRMSGFQFYVAPRVFLMHAFHPKSHARNAWRHHKAAMDKLFGEFVNEMSALREPNALPLCSERLPQFTSILRYSGDHRERTTVRSSSTGDEEEDMVEPGSGDSAAND